MVYDLRFACRYLIRLQPVSLHRVTGEMAYVSLSTPFCWQATVVGGIKPDCPRNGEFFNIIFSSTELQYLARFKGV